MKDQSERPGKWSKDFLDMQESLRDLEIKTEAIIRQFLEEIEDRRRIEEAAIRELKGKLHGMVEEGRELNRLLSSLVKGILWTVAFALTGIMVVILSTVTR